MKSVTEIIGAAEVEVCRPWLRHIVSPVDWVILANHARADSWVLLAHWADTIHAHALFLIAETAAILPVSTSVETGRYPALSPAFAGAAWFERMVHDLWGHQAEGALDLRPWLDHGVWLQSHPMAPRPGPRTTIGATTLSGPDPGTDMVLPLGPIWGLLDEAAHLRLTLNGPVVMRAESLLGFSHKGTLALMRGKSPRAAARFAARLSGDATVAHSIAFAEATERSQDVVAPPRACTLRIVMMEIERIAGHLDNLAEVGRLAGALQVHTKCGYLREILSRASQAAFGHRLMMDCVVPGGVAVDIAQGGAAVLLRVLGDIASELPVIRRLHLRGALQSRLTGLGQADQRLVTAFGVGGVVGRASGRAFDARAGLAMNYTDMVARIAVPASGDAAARQGQRMSEIEDSLRLIALTLQALPDGPVSVVLPQLSGEGIACTESSRGDVWHWLRLDHGQIAALFARDPGWALRPLAEHVMANAEAEDVGLIRASLGLSASGMDL